MTEPYVPVPDPPSSDAWRRPQYRCPECRVIVDPRPVSGGWSANCPTHGWITPLEVPPESDRR